MGNSVQDMLEILPGNALHLTRWLYASAHDPIDIGEICGVHDNNPLNGDRGDVRTGNVVKSASADQYSALSVELGEGTSWVKVRNMWRKNKAVSGSAVMVDSGGRELSKS